MGTWGLVACLLLGAVATLATLPSRWVLVRGLGKAWWLRFLLVQGLAVNGLMAYTTRAVAESLGWLASPHALWALPLGYGLGFFALCLSNADWSARKFHGLEG